MKNLPAKKAKKPVIAYLHTHWDREWYRTKEEFNLRLLEIFDEILDELEIGSMPAFYFDGQVCALEDYLKFRPEKIDVVKKLIKAGKLYVGPFFVSADNFLINGISLVRNLALGLDISKSLGMSDFIGYLPDTFGHSRSIFDILKSFNIPHSLVWRGVPDFKHNDFLFNDIKTTNLSNGYFMDAIHLIEGVSTDLDEFISGVKNLENILDKIAEKSGSVLLLPVGADHLSGLKNSTKLINEINKRLENYVISLSSPFEYVKKADYSKLLTNGELLDNSKTYILPGVYSSRIPEKAENAKLQWSLFRIVEPFNFFTGGKYSESLNYAAKMLIKNSAHDSIYGCSIDEVHRDVRNRQKRVFEVTEGVKQRLIRDFKRLYGVNPDSKKVLGDMPRKNQKNECSKIGVFNFSNYEYSGPISFTSDFRVQNAQLVRKFKGFSDEILYDTRKIPVTEDYLDKYEYLYEAKALPPFSFTVIDIVKPLSLLEFDDNKIANPYLEAKIERFRGKLGLTIVNKKTKIEYKDALKIIDYTDFGDSYNSACPNKPDEIKLLGGRILKKGPVEATLELKFEKGLRIEISLSNHSKFFDCRLKFNNNKKNRKIQMCFALKNPIDTTFSEDAFGIIERKYDYTLNSAVSYPAKPKIEVKTNSSPMQRWVMAQGFTVFGEGLNEYEIFMNTLKITVLRGTGRISEPKNLSRFVPAGPPLETPDLQCLGFLDLKFGIAPNADIASIQHYADSFYSPTVSVLGDFKNECPKKFLNLPENLIFYGLKPACGKVYGVFYNVSDADIEYKKTIKPKTIEFIEL